MTGGIFEVTTNCGPQNLRDVWWVGQSVRRWGRKLPLDDGRVVPHVGRTDGELRLTRQWSTGSQLGEPKGMKRASRCFAAVRPDFRLKMRPILQLRGCKLGVDIVGAFICRRAPRDVEICLGAGIDARLSGRAWPIVAKLERPEAIAHLDDILRARRCRDGRSRRSGPGSAPQRVPRLQKEITRRARSLGAR